jgi:hypothetical protein
MTKQEPDTLLRRAEAARALQEAGYPVAEATLATKASRGGGPPFSRFGRIPIYTWGPTLEWARSRLSEPVSSTAEAERAAATIKSDEASERSRGEANKRRARKEQLSMTT